MDFDALSAPPQAVPPTDEVAPRNGVGEERGAVDGDGGAAAVTEGAIEIDQEVTAVSAGAEDVVMVDAPPTTADDPFTSSFTAYREPDSGPPTSGISSVPAPTAAEDVPLSTPELSFPSAAQPPRPRTPPRNSSYSTAVPSSASSADTLIAGTQQTTLTPSGRPASSNLVPTQLTQTELADDDRNDGENESPDPLRIHPVPSSAASSVARSTASFRARSVSREPSLGPPLQSSPTRPARQRSKTPSMSGKPPLAENLDPASFAAKGKGRRAVSGPLSAGGGGGGIAMAALAEDDDELMMTSVAPGPVKPFGNGGRRLSPSIFSFPAGEGGAASTSMSRTSSAGTSFSRPVKAETDDEMNLGPSPAAAAAANEGRRGSMGERTEKKRGAREHTFELVVEQKRSPSLTRKPRLSKPASRGSSPPAAAASSPEEPAASASTSAGNTTAAAAEAAPPATAPNSGPSHPLSQSVPAQNETTDVPPTPARAVTPHNGVEAFDPTSPLSSLPSSSAPPPSDDNTGSTSPARRPRSAAKRSRPSRRDDADDSSADEAADGLTSELTVRDEPEASSSTAANPSPKKKARRPPKKAPLVKKAAAAPAARRRSSRGGEKALEEEKQIGEEEPMALDEEVVQSAPAKEEEVPTPVKGKGRVPKAALANGKGKANGAAKGKGKGVEVVVEVEVPTASSSSTEKEDPPAKKKAPTNGRRRSMLPLMQEASSSSASEAEEDADEEGDGSNPAEEEETEEESSESEEDDGDAYEEPKAKKKGSKGKVANGAAKKAAAREKGKGKAKVEKTMAARKGAKAKGKGKAASQSDSQDPNSSPTKGALRPTSSFASQLFGMETAAVQTPEQRAKGWSLHGLPTKKPIWVHVRREEGGFWWPGEILGNLWDKPFRVQLYLESETDSSVLSFTDKVISLDAPTSEDVVTFRNPTKLRFDKPTFRDSASAASPSDEVFDAVLELAKEKDAKDEDEDESDDGLPPPSSFGAPRPSGSQKRVEPVIVASDESEEEADAVESEDELLKADDSAGIELPALCLAKANNKWWPAQAIEYEPPSPAKKGARPRKTQPQGKYRITWTDLKTAVKPRKQLLFTMDKAFFTVELGETEHDIPPNYFKTLAAFLSDSLPPKLQRIINDDYPPIASLLDEFFAGGKARAQLAKKAVYGEFGEKVIDTIREAVVAWATKGGEGGARPTGSERYEALTDSERTSFCADVLLATAVVLNHLEDAELMEEVETELKEEGEEVTETKVEELAYKRARQQLESRSITKAVEAIRASKAIVANSKAQRKKEEAS